VCDRVEAECHSRADAVVRVRRVGERIRGYRPRGGMPVQQTKIGRLAGGIGRPGPRMFDCPARMKTWLGGANVAAVSPAGTTARTATVLSSARRGNRNVGMRNNFTPTAEVILPFLEHDRRFVRGSGPSATRRVRGRGNRSPSAARTSP
jgi:hypothetical protein